MFISKRSKCHTCMYLRYGMGYMNQSFRFLICAGFRPYWLRRLDVWAIYIRNIPRFVGTHTSVYSHECVLDTYNMHSPIECRCMDMQKNKQSLVSSLFHIKGSLALASTLAFYSVESMFFTANQVIKAYLGTPCANQMSLCQRTVSRLIPNSLF